MGVGRPFIRFKSSDIARVTQPINSEPLPLTILNRTVAKCGVELVYELFLQASLARITSLAPETMGTEKLMLQLGGRWIFYDRGYKLRRTSKWLIFVFANEKKPYSQMLKGSFLYLFNLSS